MSCSSLMDRFLTYTSVLAQALQTNWFGLGCPWHCGSFPLSAFLLAFITGWLAGVLSVLLCLLYWPWIWACPQAVNPPVPTRAPASNSRLAAYLHERGLGGGRHHHPHPWSYGQCLWPCYTSVSACVWPGSSSLLWWCGFLCCFWIWLLFGGFASFFTGITFADSWPDWGWFPCLPFSHTSFGEDIARICGFGRRREDSTSVESWSVGWCRASRPRRNSKPNHSLGFAVSILRGVAGSWDLWASLLFNVPFLLAAHPLFPTERGGCFSLLPLGVRS